MGNGPRTGRNDNPRRVCIVENLGVAIEGGRQIIEDVSFTIRQGEYFALVGESGSGKSVTCHAMMRILPFRPKISGRIIVDGSDVWTLSPGHLRQFRQRSVGMIFQDPLAALNPVRRIGAQMVETLRLHHPDAPKSELEDRAVEALRAVRVAKPGERLSVYPHQLSGGLNQRVMIAFALMGDPALLVADEPTTALDMSVQAEILDLIDELRAAKGLTVLMVTHDLGIVADRATGLAVMQGGRLVEAGPTRDVVAAPKAEYARKLFAAARVEWNTAPLPPAMRPVPVLRFESVNKSYAPQGRAGGERVVAAEKVSFEVGAGEIVALVGESGSGKTTAAKMAMGLVQPDSGRIELPRNDGRPLRPQMVFQHPRDSLDALMTLDAQFHEVLRVHGWRDAARREARIGEICDSVGLGRALLHRRPGFLSGGEAQRAVIARALLLEPDLLLADEPLSAVDVQIQKQIVACFRRLRDELGIAILLITHDLRIVLELADRVVVMRDGRVVEDVPLADFADGARDPYTQRLIDAIPGRNLVAGSVTEERAPA
ncbi:ABC transporter ATP-binding protein [Celeribacter indicus]|uniref:ABC transporter ATP-binding protein n=1 Tax=Celeribacter indicus TaxID=1208324 RepID=UPI001930F4E3|nr:ABC transporter ATP-binding protein [Celeribacter indicus]